MTTGKWFIEFIARIPPGRTPYALGIFYDHWKVSSSTKIGGLYFTILNTSPNIYLRPDNKLVLALVPENVNVQDVLKLTLECLINPNFDVIICDARFCLYIEIAEIDGDTPGLAECCCVLNHNANSPCRRCKKKKSQLFNFRQAELKTQKELSKVLDECLPHLTTRGKIGETHTILQSYGLKPQKPFFFSLPHIDICRQSLTCLMHNEELGLFRKELQYFMAHIGTEKTTLLFHRMSEMSKIPGIPAVKVSFIEKLDYLLAKEIIAIVKRITYCLQDLCITCPGQPMKKCVVLMVDHVHYLNILAQPSFYKSLVNGLQELIINHHVQFTKFYYDGATTKVFYNIHAGMHLPDYILDFGMPLFFSTMHYEPKHKQCNLLKQHQTNQLNPSRDILQKEHKLDCGMRRSGKQKIRIRILWRQKNLLEHTFRIRYCRGYD